MKFPCSLQRGIAVSLCWLAFTVPVRSAELTASDGAAFDYFGISGSMSGNSALEAAKFKTVGSNSSQGAAYLFRNLNTATGTVTQNVKLTASDGVAYDLFGNSVSLSGNTGIIGDYNKTIGSNSQQGAVYVFRNLDTATGAVTQNTKLIASDGAAYDDFGVSVSLSGNIGLIGAYANTVGSNSQQGAAYVFRNLDTATGTVTQNVKLTASDGAASDDFGSSVSLSGSAGLIGAVTKGEGANFAKGAAYLFRNLDTATGMVTQNVKLTASDGAGNDYFGGSVSLSGSAGLVGAHDNTVGSNSQQGAAYLFRNLDMATGTVTQNAKLIPSDGASNDDFGFSVSLSGNTGLVGADSKTIGSNTAQGAAYVFRNLDTITGTVTQDVKLTASDGTEYSSFGCSVSLDGDQFVIGIFNNVGKAYTGSVSSMTTLDTGSTSKTISGISFVSQDDWIVGQNTSGNQVALSLGDAATVTVSGKKVYIGQNAGSNNNQLTINGTLTAAQINVGTTGNTGNTLVVNGTVSAATAITLASGSIVGGHGSVGSIGGAGNVSPGNSAGILTATQIDPSSGMSFTFQFAQAGAPTYSNASTSGDDVLHLTSATPFKFALSSANTITLDFTGQILHGGDVYYGGFFTDAAVSNSTVSGATFVYTGLNGATMQYDGLFTVASAAFATGTVTNGVVMRFEVVPEPSTWAMLGLGAVGLLARRRRGRNTSETVR